MADDQQTVPVPDVERPASKVLEWLIPLALLYLFLRLTMGPAFFSAEWFYGLRGDTNQYMWYIGWMWYALKLGSSPFISHSFNYPSSINIMDYTSVPALSLLFGWLYSMTTVVFVYNLIVVLNYTLIFIFAKLTLGTLGVSRLFSGIGGLLFCLLPYLTAQGLMHLNLAFISPLFLLGYLVARLTSSRTRPQWVSGVVSGLALTVAFYTSLETLSTAVLFLVIVYGCAWLAAFTATRQFTRRLLNPSFLLGSAAPLLLMIPGVLNFAAGQGFQVSNLPIKSLAFSNDLLSFVLPSQLYLIHTSETAALVSRFFGNLFEWDGYLSIPFIALFVVSAVRNWRKPRTRVLAYASVVMGAFSLGPVLSIDGTPTHVFLPWLLMLFVPFIRDALPARLALYVAYPALLLVVCAVDESTRKSITLARPRVRVDVEVGASLAALALVALFWLPLLPAYHATIPTAASIIRSDQVVRRYIAPEPALVLYQHSVNGFAVVMGVLAASQSYALVTSNVYGNGMENTASFKINEAFMDDTDGKRTDSALRRYLPHMGVGRVMFISIDDQPIGSRQLAEISHLLGAPLYNRGGLVVVWRLSNPV